MIEYVRVRLIILVLRFIVVIEMKIIKGIE